MTIFSDDFRARATRIFGLVDGRVRWPYGLAVPDGSLRRRDPAQYERVLERVIVAQETIVAWAERHEVKKSAIRCCPRWLQRYASRRCPSSACGFSGADHGWLDHSNFWLKDGLPAVITSAPYHIRTEDEERIRHWTGAEPGLLVAFGVGWYGLGTRQVVMWRPDRIEAVEPATPTREAAD